MKDNFTPCPHLPQDSPSDLDTEGHAENHRTIKCSSIAKAPVPSGHTLPSLGLGALSEAAADIVPQHKRSFGGDREEMERRLNWGINRMGTGTSSTSNCLEDPGLLATSLL